MARVLAALALVAAVLGVASWQHVSRATAVLSMASAGSDVELRVPPAGSNHKARLASQDPLPLRAARARAQDRQDLRFQPMDGAAIVPVHDGVTGPTSSGVRAGDRRCGAALFEAAPESAGHRAANPARGPPAQRVAST